MSKIIYLLLGVLLSISCNDNNKEVETAIAKFVQTDRRGIWTDLQFKVLKIGVPTYITVGDSLNILNEEFEKNVKNKIDALKEDIRYKNFKLSTLEFKSIREKYERSRIKDMQQIDSLEKAIYIIPEKYKDRKKSEVLAIKVECTFSIIRPLLKVRQEMTETFILTPDGDRCLRYLH